MIFTSVDLPAPFSPTSACTSPLAISKFTQSSAVALPKRLVIRSMRSSIMSSPESRAPTSIGFGDELLRVRLVEEAVVHEDLRRHLLALPQLRDRLEGER